MSKVVFIEDINVGDKINELFYVSNWNVMKTKSGEDYLRVKLSDRTGEMDGILWRYSAEDFPKILDRTYAKIYGSARTYQGKMQFTIESMWAVQEDIDPEDFMPVSPRDLQEMKDELSALVGLIGRAGVRALVEEVFGTGDNLEHFCLAAAGKSMHHAYAGGLLEHTINVTQNCIQLCSRYPDLDVDILIAGALLHDIGKIREMFWEGPSVQYSDEGNLLGHLFIGSEMVRECGAEIESLDEADLQHILHLILSHHGEYEFGAPVLPKSMEAMLLHYADNIDAKLFQMAEAIKFSISQNEEGGFTGMVRSLERPVFKGSFKI